MQSEGELGMSTTDSPSLSEPLSPLSKTTSRGLRFWLIFLALFVSFFVVCLEGTVVATALPTIAEQLHISQFVWIGSAYALANAAVLPLCGGLAQIFGRKPVILGSLVLFAVGSAIGGAAPTQAVLILGRVLQGMGGGGTLALCTIIVSDLVSLAERGAFNGILGLAWCFSGGIGPLVGGALAQEGEWRWMFYLNIPIAATAFVMILLTLDVPTPPGTMNEKLKKIDWGGNLIVIGSTAACSIALTWGGVEHPWDSPQVLVALILGCAGMVLFFAYEAFFPKLPLIPYHIIGNRTSISGFLQTFFLSIIYISLLYYLPVYYQACKGATPTGSGVDLLGLAFSVAPITMIVGFSVNKFRVYRPQLISGWLVLIAGSGALSTINENSHRGLSIGLQVINGLGIGLLYMNLYFPILAPLPVSSSAPALSLYNYSRSIAQTWGVTIGSTVLQNTLRTRLPPAFEQQFPQGVTIAYAIIPLIRELPQPLQAEVRAAFAKGLSELWRIHIGISGAGFLISLLMKGLPLHTQVDEQWELEKKGQKTMQVPAVKGVDATS